MNTCQRCKAMQEHPDYGHWVGVRIADGMQETYCLECGKVFKTSPVGLVTSPKQFEPVRTSPNQSEPENLYQTNMMALQAPCARAYGGGIVAPRRLNFASLSKRIYPSMPYGLSWKKLTGMASCSKCPNPR